MSAPVLTFVDNPVVDGDSTGPSTCRTARADAVTDISIAAHPHWFAGQGQASRSAVEHASPNSVLPPAADRTN